MRESSEDEDLTDMGGEMDIDSAAPWSAVPCACAGES
eukprot:CAMPEP_0196579598 /NCGR_PEP_ID=MMETSP1081-20130531/23272_1 /TAXON_ID=36882 /ORGANISM="Pyramimonas amylifera, Strain CCMP720" /LENGTH=36 /DNA_ID= /DNA_START= /DNA_END= /DNA_ORIENTATION=